MKMETIYESIVKRIRRQLEGLKPLFPIDYKETLEEQSLGGGHYEALIIARGWFYYVTNEHYHIEEEVSNYQFFYFLKNYKEQIVALARPEIKERLKEVIQLALELETMASHINAKYYKLAAIISGK